MKVLFITRKYPPQVGGMEKYSHQLIKHFPGQKQVISLGKSQWHLWWFLPYALVRGLLVARQVDLVYLGDGLLAPLGVIIKKITGKPVAITAHGLDVTYSNWLYQKICIGSLKHLDRIIAVSRQTIEECVKRGVEREKCIFIPNGIVAPEMNRKFARQDLSRFLDVKTENKKIILTVGRLVKRKGHAWFIANILPELKKDILYLVAGDGPEKENIERIIEKKNLSKQVRLLGRISDKDLELIYRTADLFVMPNIKVPGDIEGFGIVAIEAAAYGLPVVASAIEGIKDAIVDGKNGFLVSLKGKQSFTKTISRLLADNQRRKELARKFTNFTIAKYSWEKLADRYAKELSAISAANNY